MRRGELERGQLERIMPRTSAAHVRDDAARLDGRATLPGALTDKGVLPEAPEIWRDRENEPKKPVRAALVCLSDVDQARRCASTRRANAGALF